MLLAIERARSSHNPSVRADHLQRCGSWRCMAWSPSCPSPCSLPAGKCEPCLGAHFCASFATARCHRAIDKLAGLPPAQPPPASAATHPEHTAQQLVARRRTQLWADVAQLAWAAGLQKLARRSAPHAMAQRWQPGSDREMLVLQVCAAWGELAQRASGGTVPKVA